MRKILPSILDHLPPRQTEQQRFIAIDVEITGLSARSGGRVIEIGAVTEEVIF